MGTLHSLNPTSLPPGTEVGPWRVLSRRASGSYGTLYRVEKVGHEAHGPFALKLATLPRDPRFEREAELLSRLNHPHVPRLRDRGWWELPGGVCFPYLVMDWVEGTPLYKWAAQCPRTSREVLRLLAQLAGAVAATHAEEGVHRDVKGDNALVLEGGTKAMLVDFGSASIRRTPRLTWQQPPPGTPQYWSPECQRFQLQNLRNPSARYEALPADDVYALGVTAYRLVTGTYPPAAELEENEHGPRLVYPPPVPPERLVSVCRQSFAWVSWLVTAASVALAISAWWPEGQPPAEEPVEVAQEARDEGQEDAGTSGLADVVLAAPVSAQQPESARSGISLELPKKPLPHQRLPPCAKPGIAIQGGCWMRLEAMTPPCGERAYEWRSECYWPILDLPRPPTSEPP